MSWSKRIETFDSNLSYCFGNLGNDMGTNGFQEFLGRCKEEWVTAILTMKNFEYFLVLEVSRIYSVIPYFARKKFFYSLGVVKVLPVD